MSSYKNTASPVRISEEEYEEAKSKFKNNIRNRQIINSKKGEIVL